MNKTIHKIAVLSKDTIDKIAAGEVVERPSSVAKELVENAIDAGASAITVEIEEGGISFLRITDNGRGMEKEDIPVAFLRHATSKIQTAEDLEEISSLGFRGEALSSIAAVAQVEVITKTPYAMTGIRYVIEGGEEKSLEEVGAPDGTTFLVRNLFYNVPARKKFLKTATTETGYISSIMEQMALSHPDVSIKYMSNGQLKLHTTGNGQMKDVIYQVYGREVAKQILPISWENEFLQIGGYLGKPTVSRGNRGFESYFINGRYVKDKIITQALEDGYHGYMMQHKYPFAVLHIQMAGSRLDVNVHPSKMQVRFSQGEDVYRAVCAAVKETLGQSELIPEVTLGKKKAAPAKPKRKESVPEPFEVHRAARERESQVQGKDGLESQGPEVREPESQKLESTGMEPQKPESPGSESPGMEPQKPESPESESQGQGQQAQEFQAPGYRQEKYLGNSRPVSYSQIAGQMAAQSKQAQAVREEPAQMKKEDEGQETEKYATEESVEGKAGQHGDGQMELFTGKLLSEEARNYHRLIGQVFGTYWLVEYGEKFFIIDQHAAHEKVLYEKLRREFKEKKISSQYLSPPLVITVDIKEELLLLEYMRLFQKMGFEIEPFGSREYSIHAVPANLYGLTGEDLFKELLDGLEKEKNSQDLDIFTDRLATMACKAAVKGNHTLSRQEADQLIDQLLTLDNPYHCPHGRPTIISMSRSELDRKFKRIV